MKFRGAHWVAAAMALLPSLALAADLDGSQLSVLWGVPFAGILLSIAIIPLVAPIFWHHHFGKVSAAWALAFLLPFALVFGPGAAGAGVVHALLAEYLPFIILLTAKGQEFDRQRGAAVGADLYMTKPFDPDSLLMKAREVLGL